MNAIEAASIQCPYCGQTIDLIVEYTSINQDYIEDCQVCCQPIRIQVVETDSGSPELIVKQENDI